VPAYVIGLASSSRCALRDVVNGARAGPRGVTRFSPPDDKLALPLMLLYFHKHGRAEAAQFRGRALLLVCRWRSSRASRTLHRRARRRRRFYVIFFPLELARPGTACGDRWSLASGSVSDREL